MPKSAKAIFREAKDELVVSFTGHRPPELGGYNWETPKNQLILLKLLRTVERLILSNPNKKIKFIVGGALGTDQMAFHICYILKKKYDNIIIELAIPVKDMTSKWFNEIDITRFNNQKNAADIVTKVYKLDNYKNSNKPFQARNEYMVNGSDLVIAVYNNKPWGGTSNCVNYAKKVNKRILFIDPRKV